LARIVLREPQGKLRTELQRGENTVRRQSRLANRICDGSQGSSRRDKGKLEVGFSPYSLCRRVCFPRDCDAVRDGGPGLCGEQAESLSCGHALFLIAVLVLNAGVVALHPRGLVRSASGLRDHQTKRNAVTAKYGSTR